MSNGDAAPASEDYVEILSDATRPQSQQSQQQTGPEFRQEVENAFNSLSQQLQEIRASLIEIPTTIVNGLPTLVKSVLVDALPTIQQMPQARYVQIDPRHFQDMQNHMQDLAANNASLIELKTTLEQEVSTLRIEVVKRTREARKLHEIIVQTGKPNADISDEDISKKFGELCHEIMRLVTRHYSIPETKIKSAFLNSLNKDDRALFVRTRIANSLFNEFFTPKSQLFGLGNDRDEAQRELENKLREREVPEADIVEWRTVTVKTALKLGLKKRYTNALKLSQNMCADLNPICVVSDADAASKEMDDLCMSAFDIAVQLRSCRATYEWRQNAKADAIPRSDVEVTGPYNASDETAPLRPHKVMFGPLYKVVDDEVLLLRTGDVLESN